MRSRRRKDRGAVLLLAAVLILVFIGVAALAVDLGQLHIAKARAQHVCDASALAGAWYLEPGEAGFNADYATETAQDLAILNNGSDHRKVLKTGTDAGEGVTVTDVLGKSITVEGQVKVNFGFATLLGFDSSRVKASSKAMLDNNLGFAYKFMPLAVTDTWVRYGDPTGNQKLSSPFWDIATGKLGQVSNLFPITFPGSSYNPGDYQNLVMGQSTESRLNTGSLVSSISNDVAPLTVDSLTSRTNGDTWTWDAWNNATGEQKATSSRIVVLPIVHNSGGTLSIVGFAGFFVQSVSLYVDPNPHIPARHRADLFGHFVPGIVGSKTVRWLKPFQPDTTNLMYRVRLTK